MIFFTIDTEMPVVWAIRGCVIEGLSRMQPMMVVTSSLSGVQSGTGRGNVTLKNSPFSLNTGADKRSSLQPYQASRTFLYLIYGPSMGHARAVIA